MMSPLSSCSLAAHVTAHETLRGLFQRQAAEGSPRALNHSDEYCMLCGRRHSWGQRADVVAQNKYVLQKLLTGTESAQVCILYTYIVGCMSQWGKRFGPFSLPPCDIWLNDLKCRYFLIMHTTMQSLMSATKIFLFIKTDKTGML